MPEILAKTKEEAELKLKELVSQSNFWVDEFYGMNCNDYDPDNNCLGWDGSSRRCVCGNRRVFWNISVQNRVPDENGNLEWDASAEAW